MGAVNSAVGPYGAPYLGAPLPPEASYPIHEPQNKSGCQSAIASSSPRSELPM